MTHYKTVAMLDQENAKDVVMAFNPYRMIWESPDRFGDLIAALAPYSEANNDAREDLKLNVTPEIARSIINTLIEKNSRQYVDKAYMYRALNLLQCIQEACKRDIEFFQKENYPQAAVLVEARTLQLQNTLPIKDLLLEVISHLQDMDMRCA